MLEQMLTYQKVVTAFWKSVVGKNGSTRITAMWHDALVWIKPVYYAFSVQSTKEFILGEIC